MTPKSDQILSTCFEISTQPITLSKLNKLYLETLFYLRNERNIELTVVHTVIQVLAGHQHHFSGSELAQLNQMHTDLVASLSAHTK